MCIVEKSLVFECKLMREEHARQAAISSAFSSIKFYFYSPNGILDNSCLKELKTFAALRSISMCYGNSASISK